MKNLFTICCALALCCGAWAYSPAETSITVSNPSSEPRAEIVGVAFAPVAQALGTDKVAVFDGDREIASQITSDSLLIFFAEVEPDASHSYILRACAPAKYPAYAVGRFHPERDDDFAWENDKIACRAYGPKLQSKGDKLYGYDLFLKRSTPHPVLDAMYAEQCSGSNWRRVNALRSEGKGDEAKALEQSFTYHLDHGHGMDCYAVGPTLGAGASALIGPDGLVFPWCFKEYEILDNGPLRFTVLLTYEPFEFDGQQVAEERVITLDYGSRLNRATVRYRGLDGADAMAGFALRKPETARIDEQARAISCIDPTQADDNGELYMGIVFPAEAQLTAQYGHLGAIARTSESMPLEYFWGYGWNRADMPSADAWSEYLAAFARHIAQPLTIEFSNPQ